MADVFITVDVEVDPQSLADSAVADLQARWPGWEPADGDPTVINIEAHAPMAADAAETASRVFPAIFRAYGTKLIGLTYQAGAAATGAVTFTLTDTDGHTIDTGSVIDIDGIEFATTEDAVVAGGDDTAPAVPVTATVLGTAGNDLPGVLVSPISALSFVASITLDAPTSGGQDAEDDSAYQDRLSQQLELQAKTIVTTRDFEIEAIDYPGVGRALAIGDTARNVTILLTDDEGQPVSSDIKTALEAIYEEFRQVNTTYTIDDADYSTINVRYTVRSYPGFVAADLTSRIDTALENVLSPANWGRPKTSEASLSSDWQNEPVIYHNKLIDLIGDVDGVDVVLGVTITGSPGTVDGVMQVDRIDFTGTVTGGTYTLTFNGQTTTALNHNATAADVTAALEALSNIESGEVLATGGPGPTDINLQWNGRYAFRAVTLTRTSSVTGGGSMAITNVTAAVSGTGDFTMTGTAPLAEAGTMRGFVA